MKSGPRGPENISCPGFHPPRLSGIAPGFYLQFAGVYIGLGGGR